MNTEPKHPDLATGIVGGWCCIKGERPSRGADVVRGLVAGWRLLHQSQQGCLRASRWNIIVHSKEKSNFLFSQNGFGSRVDLHGHLQLASSWRRVNWMVL